ncbi:MAG: hypothetical protein HOM52_04755 [Rhodospirillaceae bacterium]|nr:hypothetical protein [Rhodospirillaceae bacterium]MBT5778310.1 hypothetical protein [Rhodospirillaceae bacterium]MBT7292673.1 hypothetical protein [Rhodospirillaceae bacterium]
MKSLEVSEAAAFSVFSLAATALEVWTLSCFAVMADCEAPAAWIPSNLLELALPLLEVTGKFEFCWLEKAIWLIFLFLSTLLRVSNCYLRCLLAVSAAVYKYARSFGVV